MATRDMSRWETAICRVVSDGDTEEIIVRGHRMSELIGKLSFSEMMFLMLQGKLPTKPQARTLDALLVASMEHGIAPPSMIARCYASYGTPIQAAIAAGVNAFGDRMGGLGEQMARLLIERLAPHSKGSPLSDALLRREAEAIVDDARRAGTRVPGFGIPLHGMDPRGGKAVPMNIDGVGAVVALDLGFDWRATRAFLITPRTVSFAAHFLEEQDQDTTWRHLPAGQIDYTGSEPEG
jgi:citrate synthase